LTWSDVGSQTFQVKIIGREKQNTAGLAAIRPSRLKIPLEFVAEGKTTITKGAQIIKTGVYGRTNGEWRSNFASV
jgi:hypothetical protein